MLAALIFCRFLGHEIVLIFVKIGLKIVGLQDIIAPFVNGNNVGFSKKSVLVTLSFINKHYLWRYKLTNFILFNYP